LNTAVPADVSCADPMTAGASQNAAALLQNVTRPVVSAPFELPLVTAADSVTTVPQVTVEADTVSVVVVVAVSAVGAHRVVAIATARKTQPQ
jgi:hypothetical protein